MQVSYNIIIDATASVPFAFDGTTITIKANNFTGNITTTGTVTLSNGATITGGIIDANGDSFLKFGGITSYLVYANATNRDSNTSSIGGGLVTENFRFTYLANTIYYLRLTAGTETIFKDLEPLTSGETVVELGTTALLSALPSNVDSALANGLDGIDLPSIISGSVWDDAMQGHIIDGSFGKFVQNFTSDEMTETELHTALDNYQNKDDYKANVTGIALTTDITSLNNITAIDVWNVASRTITNTEFGLSTATINAIATEVERHLIDEADGQTIVNAIVSAIGNTNLNEVALVASIRADLERANGKLDLAMTSGEYIAPNNAIITAINTKVETLNNTDLANTNNLISAIPTNPLLASAYIAPNNAQFTSTDRTKLNSLNNYNDSILVSKVNEIDTVVDLIKIKTDSLSNTDISTLATTLQVNSNKTEILNALATDEMTENELHIALDSYENKDNWKASVPNEVEANITKVNGNAVQITDFKESADLAQLQSNLVIMNNGIKNASLLIPHSENLLPIIVPTNAIQDENGNYFLDEDGNYIVLSE